MRGEPGSAIQMDRRMRVACAAARRQQKNAQAHAGLLNVGSRIAEAKVKARPLPQLQGSTPHGLATPGTGLKALRCLFARRAGVHVDFHAHWHFDNLRCLPGHFRSPDCCGAIATGMEE
jgi:hypothetical protein